MGENNEMLEQFFGGVKEDIWDLISTNVNKKSYEFNDFVTTWNSLQFYYFYSGRPKLREMKFFTRHLLLLVKTIILDSQTDYERITAIFLLYCLYFSQPLVKKEEIRIELAEMKEIMSFVNHMKPKCIDVPYAFLKLQVECAFHCVYSSIQRTIEKSGKLDVRSLTKVVKDDSRKLNNDMIELLEKIEVDQAEWKVTETNYNTIIQELNELNIGEKNIKFTPTDFFRDILFPDEQISGGHGSTRFHAPLGRRRPPKPRKMKFLQLMREGSLHKEEEENDREESKISLPNIQI